MTSNSFLFERGPYSVSGTPANLNEAFGKFLSSLELTDAQTDLVSARHNALRERIVERAPFSIEDTILYGSYDRHSQIRPRPNDDWALDVDVLVIVKNEKVNLDKYYHYGDGGARLLEALETSIGGYQGLEVAKDAPSVAVKWKREKMKVEVTPAFRAEGGGFLVPSSSWMTTKWQFTDPVGDAAALTKANKACQNELKPLSKAFKCWNRKLGKPISSFAVEAVAYASATSSPYGGFYSELRWFFKKLLDLDGKTVSTPSGRGVPVSIDLGWEGSTVNNAAARIQNACDLERAGKHREAIEQMAIVFGPPFPLAQPQGLLGLWG